MGYAELIRTRKTSENIPHFETQGIEFAFFRLGELGYSNRTDFDYEFFKTFERKVEFLPKPRKILALLFEPVAWNAYCPLTALR